MKTGNVDKKFELGLDVIMSAGEDTIPEFQDEKEGVINTVYFDRNSLDRNGRNDEFIQRFMKYAQSGVNNLDGSYLKDNVRVFFKQTDEPENTIGVTDNPFIHEEFRERHLKNIKPPKFLLQTPDILKHGVVTVKIDGNPQRLGTKTKSLDYFDLQNPFVNQFIIVTGSNGQSDIIYKIKQDLEVIDEDRWKPVSEPYLERILQNEFHIHSVTSNMFGIRTNHLFQYLALEELLLDDQVKLIAISGEAGTGKTLIPYLAGIAQTLSIRNGKEFLQPKFKTIYLTKADNELGGRKIGFLPGDEQAKLGPIMESYCGVHDELELPFSFSEFQSLPYEESDNGSKKVKKKGLDVRGNYGRSNLKPIIQIKHSGFLRGTTLRNAFYLIDEAQNFTRREMKDLLGRAGKGSKVVIIGDPWNQIDHPINTSQKNGMVWAVHGHLNQNHPHLGIMNLIRNERSPIADYTNNIKAPRD